MVEGEKETRDIRRGNCRAGYNVVLVNEPCVHKAYNTVKHIFIHGFTTKIGLEPPTWCKLISGFKYPGPIENT